MNFHDVMLASALSKGNLAIIDRICKTRLEKVLASKLAGGSIPSEYQQCEYIASADGGQYINLGLTSQSGYSGSLVFAVEGSVPADKWLYFCGSQRSATPRYTNAGFGSRNGVLTILAGGNSPYTTSIAVGNDKASVTFRAVVGENPQINGEDISTTPIPATITDAPVALFAMYRTDGTLAEQGANPLRIYSAKFSDSTGALVRNLIPCYRIADSEIGMYDIVNETFYTNQGSGSFTKGGDV